MAMETQLICESAIPAPQGNADAGTQALQSAHLANFYLRQALDQSNEGVIILQPIRDAEKGYKIIYSNSRMIAMVCADAIIGLRNRFLKDLFAEAEQYQSLEKALHQALKAGGGAQWEGSFTPFFGDSPGAHLWRIRAVQNDFGRLLNFTISIRPVESKASLTHSVVDRNVETQRLRNDNLASTSLGVMHDLNNLLSIIMTNLSSIPKELLQHSGISEPIQEALAASQQASQFTSQAMRIAKNVPVKHESVEIAQVIKDSIRIAHSGSGVKMQNIIPTDLWWAVIDRAQISQVMQNLVINSIQAMNNSGSMEVSARNVVALENHSDLTPGYYIEILVRDRGCGMSPETLQKVIQGSYTTKENGNGIGLSTCRRIIEEHQGKLSISSMLNLGTEIYVWLPATSPQQESKSVSKQSEGLLRGKGSILIVDDEERLRKVLASVLKQCGYTVYEAEDSDSAIDNYSKLINQGQEVDLVIMDLALKDGVNGEDTARLIKGLNPLAKIIASSGTLVEENRSKYQALGFADILPKPYLAPDVARVVHQHIMSIRKVA